MNKFYLAITLTLILSFSCTDNKTGLEKLNGIEVDSVVMRSSVSMTKEKESPKCELSFNIQYAIGENADSINDVLLASGLIVPDYMSLDYTKMSIRQVIDSFARQYKEDYIDFYYPMYINDKSHPELYNIYYSITTDSELNYNGILTYIASITIGGGGQYVTHQTISKNILVKDYKVLTLSDIFMHGYEKTVKRILIDKLCEEFDVESLEGLRSKKIFADGDVYIPDNFIFGSNGLTFIFCENEIAPHDVGEIRVYIKFEEFKKLLKIIS